MIDKNNTNVSVLEGQPDSKGSIKFSHVYSKFGAERQAMLLMLFRTEFEYLEQPFLDYDTDGIYVLPKRGPCMVLLLRTTSGRVFTTIRSYTTEKWKHYRSLIGCYLDLVITEASHD